MVRMKARWIRLGCTVLLGVAAYLVAFFCDCEPLFFVAPCILSLVFMILWDVLKLDCLDNGFFSFLKLFILIGTAVFLLVLVIKRAFPMLGDMIASMDISSKESASDMQIMTAFGSTAMMALVLTCCLGFIPDVVSRWFGLIIPVASILLGLAFGFITGLFGAIHVTVSKVLMCAWLLYPLKLLISYVAENGLQFEDMDMDDEFEGFSDSSFKWKGKRPSTPTSSGFSTRGGTGSGPKPNWQTWRNIASGESYTRNLRYGNIHISVSESHGDGWVEFRVDGQYSVSVSTQDEANYAADDINDVIQDVKRSVFDKAERASNGWTSISVKTGNVRSW